MRRLECKICKRQYKHVAKLLKDDVNESNFLDSQYFCVICNELFGDLLKAKENLSYLYENVEGDNLTNVVSNTLFLVEKVFKGVRCYGRKK